MNRKERVLKEQSQRRATVRFARNMATEGNVRLLHNVRPSMLLATAAVYEAFANRDAHMDEPAAWLRCARVLRKQALVMDGEGQRSAAHQSRSDAWDCEEHATRLRGNTRVRMINVRLKRRAAGF